MTDPDRLPHDLPHDPPLARLSDTALDALLRSAPGPAPADFADRVLQRLAAQPQAAHHRGLAPPPVPRWRRLAERAALLGAAVLGMGQVLAFIFGLWAATATA